MQRRDVGQRREVALHAKPADLGKADVAAFTSVTHLRNHLHNSSLQKIFEAFAAEGFLTGKGNPYSCSAVRSMLDQAGVSSNSRALYRRTAQKQ